MDKVLNVGVQEPCKHCESSPVLPIPDLPNEKTLAQEKRPPEGTSALQSG